MGPKSNDRYPYKRQKGEDNTESVQRGESHVKTEAEIGMMLLQGKERQGLSTGTRSWKRHGMDSWKLPLNFNGTSLMLGFLW